MAEDDHTSRALLPMDDTETQISGAKGRASIDVSSKALDTQDGGPAGSLRELDQSLPGGGDVDHFRIKRLLGRGGMGEVYLARDTRLGRRVALKVIRADKLSADQATERFLLEARATARFSHPNIVTIHAVGEVDGAPYVALEYLEGEDLAQRMRRESVPPAEAMRIGRAVADALAEAHRHGILHRDLKPGNVMLPRDGRVRVVDFGLAQAVEVERDDSMILDEADVPPLPESGEAGLAGTPAYMAPEQWKDEPSSEATDVWALGVLLFELCAGMRPFRGTVTRVALRVCSQEVAPRLDENHAPRALADLVAECLSKSPENRPPATDVAMRLESILRGDSQRVGARPENPFRGLMAFSDRHADLFFGRDAEIMAFVESLRDAAVLPLLGPSGAGKSSFIMAGVIPRLRERERFTVMSVRPGNDPFGTLAGRLLSQGQSTTSASGETASSVLDPARVESLRERLRETPSSLALELQEYARREGGMVMLFVDQLEELYTLNPDQELRDAFMDAVCCAADDPAEPVRVVYTARDDFLGRLAATDAARATLRNMMLLQRPEPAALEEILQRPLDAVGFDYEDPEMVRDMVAAVEGEPAGLALLQFAAHRLWLRRDEDRRILLRSVYDEMGGVAGALAGHADGVVDALSRPEHRLARELMLRLVTPERTRKVVARQTVLEGLGPDAEWVLDRLVEARLLTVRKGRRDGTRISLVELAHESLTRAWGSLAQWIEDSRDDLAFLAQVSGAADHWAKAKQDHALWAGDELADAKRWLARASTEVPDRVRAFIETSTRQQSRRQWRRRWLVLGTILALVVVDIYVIRQQRIAEDERAAAQVRRAEALREGGFASLREGNVRDARAKLRSAIEIADAPEARALWWQIRGEPRLWAKAIDSFIYRAPVSPDGRYAAAVTSAGVVYLVDLLSGTVRGLHAHHDHVRAAAFSKDGQRLVTGGSDTALNLWNVQSGRRVASRKPHNDPITDLALSGDGRFIASASRRAAEVALLRAKDLTPVPGFATPETCKRPQSVSFDHTSSVLAVGCRGGTVQLYDLASQSWRDPLETGTRRLAEVRFSPATAALAVAGGGVEIWNIEERTRVHDFAGRIVAVGAVGFDDSGERLAVASGNLVRVIDVRTGTVTPGFAGHESTVTSVSFMGARDQIVSASYDRTIRIWDASSAARPRPQDGHLEPVNSAAISADGTLVASGSHDKTVRIWSVATGAQLHTLEHFGVVRGVALSASNEVAGLSWAGATARWDAKTGAGRGVFSPTGGLNVAYNPKGDHLLAVDSGGQPARWGTAERRIVRHYASEGRQIKMVANSPDDRFVAATYATEGARVWPVESATPLRLLPQKRAISLDFSPTSERLAVGGLDEVVVWDYRSGERVDEKRLDGRVWQVDYSADGRYLGAAGSAGMGRIWDLETGGQVDLVGHRTEVNGFGFGPQGRLAVTASDDGTVRLWETATGRPYWRAPMMASAPGRLLTQQGWLDFASGDVSAGTTTWEKNAAVRARKGHADDGFACWIGWDETLELWDVEADQRRYAHALPGAAQVMVTPYGCAARADAVVTVSAQGDRQRVVLTGEQGEEKPVALGRHGGQLLVATAHSVFRIADGIAERIGDAGAGVRVITGSPAVGIILGYADGNIEVLDPQGQKRDFVLEDTPVSPVSSIALGPAGVVAVGYATGLVGVWGLEDGKRFDTVRLHGAVDHLLVENARLYAGTEFGQRLAWRLSDFLAERCAVLREIWAEIPFTWEGGRAVATPLPADHECARNDGAAP